MAFPRTSRLSKLPLISQLHLVNVIVQGRQHARTFSSTKSFSYSISSLRRYRRSQKMKARQRIYKEKRSGALEGLEEHEVDNRTWRTILFPSHSVGPHHDHTPEQRVKWPKTPTQWKWVFRETSRTYMSTWEGFFSNMDKANQPKEGEHDSAQAETSQMLTDVSNNFERNIQELQKDGKQVLESAQKGTGIYTLDDLKKLAMEMMTVATECLSEFMAGYRKGRDDEVEKMLTEYFQNWQNDDDEKKDDHRPKRKPKRRVPAVLTRL